MTETIFDLRDELVKARERIKALEESLARVERERDEARAELIEAVEMCKRMGARLRELGDNL